MFERFTEKGIKGIMLAQEEARRLGHNFVGTEQLLLGIYSTMDQQDRIDFFSPEVSLKHLRGTVESIIGRGSGFVAVEIPFTPRAKYSLDLAWDTAKECGHNFITHFHILVGILSGGESGATQVLEKIGVDTDALQATAIKLLKEKYPSSAHVRSVGFSNLLLLAKKGWDVEHFQADESQRNDSVISTYLRIHHVKDHLFQNLGTIGRLHANRGGEHKPDFTAAQRPEMVDACGDIFIAVAQLCNEEGITADELESSLSRWARGNAID